MMNTVIGLFDDRSEAQAAERDLLQSGFKREECQMTEQPPSQGKPESGGFWNRMKDWLGMDDQDLYAEAARQGGKLVTVTASDDAKTKLAQQILEKHHPVDIDSRAAQWQQQRCKTGSSSQTKGDGKREQGKQSIPVVKEELKVGKRQTTGKGGVRVYSRVTERPVDEAVQLREERVNVERRRVDRPAGPEAFKEQTIEMTEIREEPVVSKEARVVEEVVVNKETTQRTEHVRDKVRQTQVEVEKLDDRRRD